MTQDISVGNGAASGLTYRLAMALLAIAVVFSTARQASAQATGPAPVPAIRPATMPELTTPAILPPGSPTVGKIQATLDTKVDPLEQRTWLLLDLLHKLEGLEPGWLEVPGSTLNYLPYGGETQVVIGIPAGVTVRRVLDSLLDPLNLRYRLVEDDRGRAVLRILPQPELIRIAHRPTLAEAELLFKLRRLPLDAKQTLAVQVSSGLKRPISIQFDLSGLDAVAASKKLDESIAALPEHSPADVLDQFCRQDKWTWRVDDNRIIVLDRVKQIVHQLRRRVSVRWSNVPLEQALTQLCNSAGVMAQFQPGLTEGVEASSRQVSWAISDEPILQIIETLSARTGIAYEVREESVCFSSRKANMDPIVGQVTVPTRTGGFSFQFFIRKSMLSPAAQDMIDRRLHGIVDTLNKELIDAPPAGANPAPTPPG